MKRIVVATLSLVLTGTGLLWAASGQTKPAPDPKIGTRITITGCLHKGTGGDSFVLLGVTERPADAAGPVQLVPFAIYWLNSTDGLKPLVGEFVDVTGKVTERRPQPGTITVNIDVSEKLSTDVNVANANKALDVTTKKFDDAPRPAGTSTSDSTIQVQRPVSKLKVDDVHAVA